MPVRTISEQIFYRQEAMKSVNLRIFAVKMRTNLLSQAQARSA
jgi:hypothetical protein